MGTAGLDVERVTHLLQRIKVDCTLVQGDDCEDRCLLRLTSVERPGQAALLEYLNQRSQPRIATIKLELPEKPRRTNLDEVGHFFWVSEEGIRLRGSRKDDPEKLVALVKGIFLKPKT